MSVLFSDAELICADKLGQTSLLAPPRRKRQPVAKPNDSALATRHAPPEAYRAAARPGGRFTDNFFRFGTERYAYRLFVPDSPQAKGVTKPRPLVVLLHGCQQDAADFAQGTGMNTLAQQHQCMVLYPEQLSKSNQMRCWNWYERGHQSRDAGEPAMLAGLTRHVLETQNGDLTRVYIAGLSAGGAMAALMARLFPELFAAAGVHSGLAAGAAGDVMSAFSAMCNGASRTGISTQAPGPTVPTIVFHGSEDKTVHPANGEQVVLAAVAGLDAAGLDLVKSGELHEDQDGPDALRRTQRTRYSAANGISHVEHWAVDAGPHAWSGGHSAGSFTDPQGPGASKAMLNFFLQHRNLATVSLSRGRKRKVA